jgi:5-methylthioadenosine/S-adenosylhomocysteine deaminase
VRLRAAVIEGDTITCVAADCTAPAGATRVTVTNAYIFPDFVDAHNHVAYNVLPRWLEQVSGTTLEGAAQLTFRRAERAGRHVSLFWSWEEHLPL